MARAFNIGKFESTAIFNLQRKVSSEILTLLQEAVRVRGMRGFIHHETIARDVFNAAFSSGVGAIDAWQGPLTNREDNKLVPCLNQHQSSLRGSKISLITCQIKLRIPDVATKGLFCDVELGNDLPVFSEVKLLVARMCGDWDRQAPNMRKSWGYRDTVILHGACGCFLHCMECLQEKIPSAEFLKASETLKEQFMSGFFDPDLQHTLDTSAPPVRLDVVPFLRSVRFH